MHLMPEEREVGKTNFHAAIGSKFLWRNRLQEAIRKGVASKKGLGSFYFGYGGSVPEPVRVGVIGTGDEGSVLIGALNPQYIAVRAIADIRPYNVWRAFHGDCSSEAALAARPGLQAVYGWKSEDAARGNVKVYGRFQELIDHAKEDKIEAVILALPLHMHAPAAIAAMRAGLHVITEKLMGHSVHECKEMTRVAKETKLLLATGHQRHYSILYDSAVKLIQGGLLGELHFIRARWHRGNLPGHDSWQQPMPESVKPDDPLAKHLARQLKNAQEQLAKASGAGVDLWRKRVDQAKAQIADKIVDAEKFGYQNKQILGAGGKVVYQRPAIEELIRWRLWDRTGAGLMAELGSHQLDAASIFIAAVHGGVKQHPLTVAAVGNRPLFGMDREIEDHVCCIFEFPAPGYDANDPLARRKKIGVQYASINGNGFGEYGETALGTEGTLLLDNEKDVMLYKVANTSGKTKVLEDKKKTKGAKDAKLVLDIQKEGDEQSAAIGHLAMLQADRGYAEELEHWAWCIRNPAPENLPRCHPTVALGDAIIALTANMAARQSRRIEFEEAWFDADRDETPEGVKPDLSRYQG
jgi:predicted dehydrogenase